MTPSRKKIHILKQVRGPMVIKAILKKKNYLQIISTPKFLNFPDTLKHPELPQIFKFRKYLHSLGNQNEISITSAKPMNETRVNIEKLRQNSKAVNKRKAFFSPRKPRLKLRFRSAKRIPLKTFKNL